MLLILHIPFIKFPDKRAPDFSKVVTNEYDINYSLENIIQTTKSCVFLLTWDDNWKSKAEYAISK